MQKMQTTPHDHDTVIRQRCDAVVTAAARAMVNDIGAPMPMVLDRILTFAGAQAAAGEGAAAAARHFRELADRIEAGAFGKGGH